ncbi:hypothetical protein NIES267_33930 [Calothrix parasitica NIES-267]|uniref:Uncharacterized protein n=1 Tax=Calothrix parasitica NIES-267 TaxID=1973488 RepID=A0A1Z4LRM8_9CYAN|nr:hypothetical protein NIES267_33930 [Calothrix parasitica NIES-267]
MNLIFDDEVNNVIASKSVIIVFFGLPEKQQVEILPVLDEEKNMTFQTEI